MSEFTKGASEMIHQMGLSENVVYPIVPTGFADHYPYEKWLFHWEYTLFSDKPKWPRGCPGCHGESPKWRAEWMVDFMEIPI